MPWAWRSSSPPPNGTLDCDDGYLGDRGHRSRLPLLDLVDPILERELESPFVDGDFTVLWHAGEPMAMQTDFYEQATARIRAAEARHRGGPLRIQQTCRPTAP